MYLYNIFSYRNVSVFIERENVEMGRQLWTLKEIVLSERDSLGGEQKSEKVLENKSSRTFIINHCSFFLIFFFFNFISTHSTHNRWYFDEERNWRRIWTIKKYFTLVNIINKALYFLSFFSSFFSPTSSFPFSHSLAFLIRSNVKFTNLLTRDHLPYVYLLFYGGKERKKNKKKKEEVEEKKIMSHFFTHHGKLPRSPCFLHAVCA